MPTKPAKPTDWAEVKSAIEMIYRDYASHVTPESFPMTFPLDGRGWSAEIKISKKNPIK
jgi:hypothetical protein